MKKTWRGRVLAMLLVLALTVGLVPAALAADSSTPVTFKQVSNDTFGTPVRPDLAVGEVSPLTPSAPTTSGEKHCPSRSFRDLDTTKWYHEAIDTMLNEGLMNGTGNGLFEPNATLTRAMLVTILWRSEGKPAASAQTSFTDVPAGAYYAEAVRWAAANGVVKGVSFQCCPAALIYRRSIAQDVLGTDDPAEVQKALSDWDKFNDVAAQAKAKGYMMTASESATYRVFSNNVASPWVDENNNLQIDDAIKTWMTQAKEFSDKGYTQTCDIWSDECTAQMFGDGKAMCYFGPAWYFNFSMGNAQDADKGCFGDWAICEGPQAHFWGGTWLLAPAGTDNPTMVADIMNTFINNEEVCTNLVKNEAQFSNNQKVNETVAQDPAYGSDFLGGQNDIALLCDLAKNIKFENHTIYDQLLNEGLQANWREYCKGTVTEDEAMSNFYKYINEKYPTIVTP